MLHGIRVDEVKSMIRRLYLASQAEQAVDMKTILFEMLLNIMMTMIDGKRYYGENVEDIEEATRFREIVMETMRIGGATNMGDFLPVLRWLKLGGVEQSLKELQEKRYRFIQDLIRDFRNKMEKNGPRGGDSEVAGKKKSLIEVLLTMQETEPEYYKDQIIGSLMLVRFLAKIFLKIFLINFQIFMPFEFDIVVVFCSNVKIGKMVHNPIVLQSRRSDNGYLQRRRQPTPSFPSKISKNFIFILKISKSAFNSFFSSAALDFYYYGSFYQLNSMILIMLVFFFCSESLCDNHAYKSRAVLSFTCHLISVRT
jgi:hypothetical protein